MTDAQRAVIQNWLEMCRTGDVKVGGRVLEARECDLLAQAIRAIAGDLEIAGKPWATVTTLLFSFYSSGYFLVLTLHQSASIGTVENCTGRN